MSGTPGHGCCQSIPGGLLVLLVFWNQEILQNFITVSPAFLFKFQNAAPSLVDAMVIQIQLLEVRLVVALPACHMFRNSYANFDQFHVTMSNFYLQN